MNLPSTYNPSDYEKDIYNLWEMSGAFKPSFSGKSNDYFSMVMPPPNANDNLHLGHALIVGLEDIIVRYKRLKNIPTLYVPGADHAGFETWVVYEKKLNKEGKTRFDFTREELYSQVWDFVQANKEKFNLQLRSLGVSCDWSRFTFTLDKKVVTQAYETFHQMWRDKLIYRGQRLVNYCTFHGTSFSDIEVVYKTEQGRLWYINYPLVTGNEFITIATTRPETMLGDTAVAVNPKDKRYQKYIGKTLKLPLLNREIPIVADDMVDPKFGTGAVKITPAHDINDYEVAQRHNLPMISVITTEGKMADDLPINYRDLDVAEARKAVVSELQDQGLLVKEEKHSHRVGHCYKCDTVIQPLLKEQWFVSMKPLAKEAVKQLEGGEITFYPASKLKQSIEYLNNIKDWNISRQIAWGIPIPAFQNVNDPDDWIYDTRVEEETINVNGNLYRRDPDVFDTWFSSTQWPFITLSFPDSKDYKKFYPNSLMETGGEILYQWVCRMIMMGLYVTKKVPFTSVYINGYVLASDGSKMSKSVGNVVNPIPIIENYGSDALRIGLINGRSAGVNQGFDLRKIEDARNFCNKIWNIARFIETNVSKGQHESSSISLETEQDHWIVDRLNKTITRVDESLNKYDFNDAFSRLYHFIWNDFADWYIETSKTVVNNSLLSYCLESVLTLTHPFAPFLTETIWQTIHTNDANLLITGNWPDPAKLKAGSRQVKSFVTLQNIVSEVRLIKSTLKLTGSFDMLAKSGVITPSGMELIRQLTGVKTIESTNPRGLRLTSHSDCFLDLTKAHIKELLNNLKQQENEQLEKVEQLSKRLSNKQYITNAPKDIVKQSELQLKQASKELKLIKERTKVFLNSKQMKH